MPGKLRRQQPGSSEKDEDVIINLNEADFNRCLSHSDLTHFCRNATNKKLC
jgi:hypothetical protein